MPRHTGAVLLGVLLMVLGSGCVGSWTSCYCQCGRRVPAEPPPPPLPVVTRGNLEVLFQGLPPLVADEVLPGSTLETAAIYYGLTPKDCQCLAARCCGVANLMARERRAVADQDDDKCLCLKPKRPLGGTLKQELLADAEMEARSQQAGAALELYYRLAEAEAGLDLLQAAVAELDSALVKGQELREKDLITDDEYEKLKRQRYKTLRDRTELQMNIERLNVELGKLLCIRACPGQVQFWPLLDLDATCGEVDAEEAAKVAVATRGELQALRALRRDLNLLTLPAARQALHSINSTLGAAEPQSKVPQLQVLAEMLCHEGPFSTELQARRQQLTMRITEREEAVAADVREAAAQIVRRCQTSALAKKISDSLAKRVREVEDLHRKNLALSSDVTKTRLEWLQARGEVVKEIAARERAKANLKQHQGVLPLECPDPEPPAGTCGRCGGCR